MSSRPQSGSNCFDIFTLIFAILAFRDYKPEYEKLRQDKEKNEQRKKEKQLQRLEKDMGKGDEILNNSNQPESTSNNSRPTIQIYNQNDENENIQVNAEVDGWFLLHQSFE